MYILKKLIRSLEVAMMIKEYGLLTKLHHILMDTKENM